MLVLEPLDYLLIPSYIFILGVIISIINQEIKNKYIVALISLIMIINSIDIRLHYNSYTLSVGFGFLINFMLQIWMVLK